MHELNIPNIYDIFIKAKKINQYTSSIFFYLQDYLYKKHKYQYKTYNYKNNIIYVYIIYFYLKKNLIHHFIFNDV